jgi:hypothetical protein
MSLHDEIGISVVLQSNAITVTRGTPNTVAWSVASGMATTLTHEITSYSHTLNIIGGYDSAQMTLVDDVLGTEWWIEYGLGQHVQVRSHADVVIWEGFVNTLGVSLGALEMELGPVLDIGNRVEVVFSPTDTTLAREVQNVREFTTWGENADSQERYGVRHALINLGNATSANATLVAGLQLRELAWPKRTQRLGVGGSKPSVSLGCLGWWHYLDYPYHLAIDPVAGTAVTGTVAPETKIAAILAADPNGLFPGPHGLAASGITVPANEEQERTAQDILRGLATLGNSTYARASMQVGEGRRLEYAFIGNTPDYMQSLTDPSQNVYHYGGGRVFPWEVQAGKWLIIPDLLAGHTLPADLRENPRAMLIEQVNYSAPYDLQLQAGASDRLSQALARIGLAGSGR